ncbi:MAG: hypothetical protein J3Q66DRAFT_189072 [Benniella sp.]|nr:MAG: hypothetical protein J3Q66DRAFT_189072 [Benniella sp.]
MGREKYKHGRHNSDSRHDNDIKMKDASKEALNSGAKKNAVHDTDTKASQHTRPRSLSPPESPPAKARRKDLKGIDRDGSIRSHKSSRDNDSRRPTNDSNRHERERSTKHRHRGQSRSPSRSRSPRRNHERTDGREVKQGKDRRDHDDSGLSRNKLKEDSGRSHREKSTKGRRDRSRSRSRSSDRIHGRERSRDRRRRRSRSRSRDGTDRKRDRHKRSHDTSTGTGLSNTKDTADISKESRSQSSQGTRQVSERREASSSIPSTKKASESQQQKRPESNVDTPKTVTDSPAFASTSSAYIPKTADLPQEGARLMSVVSTESVPEGQTKYFRDYRRYHTLAVSLKRKADEITRIQNNPRLGAIVYFLSGNAFLRAFYFNDKHLELLHPNRPDLVHKESMACWGSMKQFSTALSSQFHGKFQGLEGLCYLLEALVYHKCHTYSSYRLRQEMQALDQLRKRASKDNNSSRDATEPTISVPTDLAARLLQNAEEWANLSTKLVDCEVAFTPDIAKEQFPEAFRKWCIHPLDVGKAGGDGFLTHVEQRQTVVVSTDDGVLVQEMVRKIPKVQWPLGTYMHLSDIMDFAEEALREYQVRNDLEYEPPSIP